MNQQIQQGLDICYGVANILKEQYPNEIMKIIPNTIIEYSRENSRLISNKRKRLGMGNSMAYYSHSKPHRVVIKQKVLKEQYSWLTKISVGQTRTPLFGKFALVDIICHEMAHHRTKGHGAGFKIKYMRFLQYMVCEIISGNYYKHINKADQN